MKIHTDFKSAKAFLSLIAVFSCLFSIAAPWNGGGNALLANEPTVPASNLNVALTTCNEADLSWNNGNGSRRLVIGSAGAPVSQLPVDATTYSANSIFGSGANLTNDNYVVYNGNGNNVTVTGLNAAVHYYFSVFEFNGTGSGINYLISTYPSVDTVPTGVSLVVTSSDPVICQGDVDTLRVHGAHTYSWSPSTGLSSTTDSVVRATPTDTIRYTVTGTDAGCIATERIVVTVNTRPIVTLSAFAPRCQDAGSFTLSGGSPTGGTYSGRGVNGGIFDPVVAGAGTDTVYYAYTNSNGCSNSAFRTITVYAPPTATFTSPGSTCTNAAPFALSGGSPAGGTYSGPGVSGGNFNPSAAGSGAKTIVYEYTDSHGCSDTASAVINVYNPPTVTLASFVNTCENAPAFTLSGGSPASGVYSGNGVSGGTFNPALAGPGVDTIHYTYFNAQGCSATASQPITVYAVPVVTLASLDSTCTNRIPFALTGGSPAGGTYSGPGVSGGVFNPANAGVGTHTIVYTYTNGQGCTATASASIKVFSPTTAGFSSPGNKCENAAPVTLTGGSPSGGVYSGSGVSSGVFDPSAVGPGVDTLHYTYTNSHGCVSSANAVLTVLAAPVVSLGSFNAVCSNAPNFVLTGGSPSNGFYFGAGISGGQFHPSTAGAGTHTVSYAFTNGQGCSDTATSTIVVNQKPTVVFSSPTPVCANTTPFTLSGGSPAGGIYTGTAINGNIFNPAVADTGLHGITYTYTDSLGCRDSASASITVWSVPVVTFSPMQSACENTGPVNLNGGSPAGGTYSGTAVISGKFYTGLAGAGTHPILYTYTNSNGCSGTATQSILVNVIPHPNLGPDTLVCSDTHLSLNPGSGFTTYAWSTGQTTTTIVVDTTGRGLGTFSFRVIVTNSFACANRDTIRVTFDPCGGIQPVDPEAMASIYPNPFQQSFTLTTNKPIDLTMYDLTGRIVYQLKEISGIITTGEKLHPGIYLAEIRSGSKKMVYRVVKMDGGY